MNERTVPPISSAAAAFLAHSHRPFINGRFVDGLAAKVLRSMIRFRRDRCACA